MEISKVAMLSKLPPPAFAVFPSPGSACPPNMLNVIKYSRCKVVRFPRSHTTTTRALGHNSGISIRRSELASVSSSSFDQQNASVVANPAPIPPPPSQVGSPLFWVGVGVAFSAFFSWLASYLKNYAMKQAFKTMMNQMNPPNTQNTNSPFGSGNPFPFPMPPPTNPAASPFASSTFTPPSPSMPPSMQSPPNYASKPSVTVDIPVTQVKEAPQSPPPTEVTEKNETPKKYAFVDVSPEDTLPQRSTADLHDVAVAPSFNDASSPQQTVFQNGNIPSQTSSTYQSTDKSPLLSLEALEKMLEDPTVQRMVYPYLPEEMRNPSTFKWMLQNPVYRKQLEGMLSNMSGNAEWDNRMVDSLKNFDLSSPEVKQQFDQIGLTPEEVISKIMANPEVAMAFQNPKVQQAILDCSQNPMNITKYQNDKEVMDVFEKISELFPGVGGSP